MFQESEAVNLCVWLVGVIIVIFVFRKDVAAIPSSATAVRDGADS
jgi:hypothetical protein